MIVKKCFAISSFIQLNELLEIRKNKRKSTIIFIKYHLINGFGIYWLKTSIKMIRNQNKRHIIKFCVDCNRDFGLSIMLIKEKIDFIKLKSNPDILKKINNIAIKNKVAINTNFNVVDLTKIKNLRKIESKIK